MIWSFTAVASMALFLMHKGGRLPDRGPGPPGSLSNQLPYTMDVTPVRPYQAPVHYMRNFLDRLESRPRDINFFLELAREPNSFMDILGNYQHGISSVVQVGNVLLAVVAIGGVVVVAGRWVGYFGADSNKESEGEENEEEEGQEEPSPSYKTAYTTAMAVTLFLAAIGFVLSFLLYETSSDLSASIDTLPVVKEMAARDLAAFVTNTINQRMEDASRKKRRHLDEIEGDFEKAFSRFLESRMHEELVMRNGLNVTDCAQNVRQIGMLFVKDGVRSQGNRLLRASKSLARISDYRKRLCGLVAKQVAKTTSKERKQVVKSLKKQLHDSAKARAEEELKETLSGLDRAFNRLMTYGSRTGWWERFRSSTLFGLVPIFFLCIFAIMIPFIVVALTQQNVDEETEAKSTRFRVAGVALAYGAFFLYIVVVLALYLALQVFPYAAVGECYLCNSYRQGSFKVLNMLAVRLWPLNERASIFRGIHPSEILGKCSHGDATLADLSIPAEVRQDMDVTPGSTRVPLLDTESLRMAKLMPSFLVHDRHVALLPADDVNVTVFVKTLRISLSKERALTDGTRRTASAFLKKLDKVDLQDAAARMAATSYRRMLLTMLPKYYAQYLHGPTITQNVGNCGPVYNVVDKTMSATCDGFVDSLLAFVFFLVVTAIVSTLVAVMAAAKKKKKKKSKSKKKKKSKSKKKKKGSKSKKKKKGSKSKKKKGSKSKKKKSKSKKGKKKASKSDEGEKSEGGESSESAASTSASASPTTSAASAPAKPAAPAAGAAPAKPATPTGSGSLKTASQPTLIRVTSTRTEDTMMGPVDETEFVEIRLPGKGTSGEQLPTATVGVVPSGTNPPGPYPPGAFPPGGYPPGGYPPGGYPPGGVPPGGYGAPYGAPAPPVGMPPYPGR
ncbi:uncharacterized protein LOC144130333 [Amblyomma americanum]|uniref:Uncharacterized protein n=1 Tax=Amblyomma americanum TaxID=6943 RepID=A0AAQ4EYV5_AMBAM